MVPWYKVLSVMTFSRIIKRFTPSIKEGNLKSKSPPLKVLTGVTQENIEQVKNLVDNNKGKALFIIMISSQLEIEKTYVWRILRRKLAWESSSPAQCSPV